MSGYDQSGHIPNVTLSDWQQGASHGKKVTLGSMKGLGPWTFGLGKVSWSMGNSKSAPGFKPGWCQKGTLASAKGFRRWTFGPGKVICYEAKLAGVVGLLSPLRD